jgi:hypothetical protein
MQLWIWRNLETSKLFKRMGIQVGIQATKKAQRGIIARKFMNQVKEFELAKFQESCPQIKFI